MQEKIRVNIKGVVKLRIADLNAFQEDIKILTDENYEKLKEEILQDGFSFSPHVFMDKDGKAWILDGHQRRTCLERMKKEGYKVPVIPCMEVTAESLEHARRLVLAGTSQYGTFQVKKLVEFTAHTGIDGQNLLKRFVLPTVNFEKLVNVSGYVRGGGVDEEVPEPEIAKSKRGQIWALGAHRVMCGDSTDPKDVAALMKDNSAELCFTSPPYVDQRDYGGDISLSVKGLAKFITAVAPYSKYFGVNLGISRKDGEIIQYWDEYILAARSAGLKLLSWNVWDRMNAFSLGQQTAMFPIEHEWVFIFGDTAKKLNRTIENKTALKLNNSTSRLKDGSMKQEDPYFSHSHRPIGTVIRADVQRGNEFNHPARFPVALPEAYILAMTKEKGTVIDPFGGSGSTLIAAEKNQRICFMMELNPIYVDMIISRWENFTGQKAEAL